MKVVVTGAAGFIGAKLVKHLLEEDSPLCVTELVLVDMTDPATYSDSRVQVRTMELSKPGAAEALITAHTDVLFHLAAVVSGHAEVDFDLGLRINFDVTRALLEQARRINPKLRLVFTSTVGVFGGDLPPVVTDTTAPMPQNSYGTAKAMSELLINDYSRRGWVDARIVRLPTVSVRSGAANAAVTSFASGIVREPLAGLKSVCPVPEDQEIWLTSPAVVVQNIVHAAILPTGALGPWRVVNLPGITVSVKEMVSALSRVAGQSVASRVVFKRDEKIAQMVGTFPLKFDNTRALRLGFTVDPNFENIISAYIKDDLEGSYIK